MAFDRISTDHEIMRGVPCIRGTRIPVTSVVGMVAERMTADAIIEAFPQLTGDDIQDALRYAVAALDVRERPGRPELIVRDPKVCHGQATVRGTRIPVTVILDNLASGHTDIEILAAHPTLTREAIHAAVAYAADLVRDEHPAVGA